MGYTPYRESQSLLNEVKYSNYLNINGEEFLYEMSQSLLNEVKYSNALRGGGDPSRNI